MKNNRQVGLDGKIYLTSCLKRAFVYIFGLFIYGMINAFADILKLTGKSGYKMSSLTITLISFDLLLSLLLIVVVFYAFFLECGSAVPVLKDKPLIVLGYCRMSYDVLLCYYIVYRAMYCIANRDSVPFGTLAFYVCYMVVTFLSIIACCFVLNILQRNMIRRVFLRSFRTLGICGIVFSSLVPIFYIVARFFMKEIGDEYFTTALCDILRLCVAPLFYICLWVSFLKARSVTVEVFGEVDNAIRDRRYQITYKENVEQLNEPKENKKLQNKRAEAAAAAATVAAIEASHEKTLPAANNAPQSEEKAVESDKKDSPIGPVQMPNQQPSKKQIQDEKLREAVSQAVAQVIKEEAEQEQAQNNTPPAPPKAAVDFNPFEQAERAQRQANAIPNANQPQHVNPQVRHNNAYVKPVQRQPQNQGRPANVKPVRQQGGNHPMNNNKNRH